MNSSDRTDEELRHLAKIPRIREDVRARVEPLCRHLPQDALDRMIDDIALVQYRYERATGMSFNRAV